MADDDLKDAGRTAEAGRPKREPPTIDLERVGGVRRDAGCEPRRRRKLRPKRVRRRRPSLNKPR